MGDKDNQLLEIDRLEAKLLDSIEELSTSLKIWQDAVEEAKRLEAEYEDKVKGYVTLQTYTDEKKQDIAKSLPHIDFPLYREIRKFAMEVADWKFNRISKEVFYLPYIHTEDNGRNLPGVWYNVLQAYVAAHPRMKKSLVKEFKTRDIDHFKSLFAAFASRHFSGCVTRLDWKLLPLKKKLPV